MIIRQMTKQMKQIQPQVSLVLESILDNVVQKNQKRVTWLPAGIKEARTFEIEPWRNMKPTPISQIKSHDEIAANPYTLPLKMKHMKPYFDHSKWEKPKPSISDNLLFRTTKTHDKISKLYDSINRNNGGIRMYG